MQIGEKAGLRIVKARRSRRMVQASEPLLLVVALLSIAVLGGCTGVVSASKSPDPTAGTFQLSPATLSFGNVVVGKQGSQTVAISNTGTASVTITQATVSNPQFTVSGMSLPMTMTTGQTGSITIGVKPTATGTLSGTLTVQADAGSEVVNLSATAVAASPQISLSSSAINFGSITLGSSASSNLTISNTGAADLTISSVSLTGAGFTITGIATPKVVTAGQSTVVTLTYSPTATGAAAGSLSINSSDTTNPKLTVSLSGTGTTAPTGTLQASQAGLSFGNVSTGSNLVKQVVVTNTGTAAVQISGVGVTGTGFTVSGLTTPATVNPSSQVTLSVTFAPTTAGNASGTLSITSNASGSPLSIPVSGTGVQPGITISPASFNFGSVVDGQNKSQAFTITNSGTAPLTISQLGISAAGYSVSGLSVPSTVAPGSSVSFSALFAPTTVGNLAGTVSVGSNAPNSPATVVLSGTGVAVPTGALQPNLTSLSFGNISTGSNSVKQVVVTNTGSGPVQITGVGVTGTGFTVSGVATPTTVNASGQVTLSVTFAPTTTGNVSGTLSVTSNASGSPLSIPVSGAGVQPGITISPASFNFGSVVDGQTKSQAFTITNSGTASLTISQLSISAAGYSVSGLSVPSTVAPGSSVSFSAVFAPTTAGSLAGTVNVGSNAPNSPAAVALSGTGVAQTLTLSFSATSFAFGNVNTGTSVTQTETITNTGNSNVQISQINLSATGYSLSGAGAPVTLSPSQKLIFSVIFDPSAAGAANGSIQVTSNATGSPTTISLSGNGVVAVSHTVGLSWNASTSTVNGYNVYRSTTSGSGYVKVNGSLVSGLSYTDSGVQNGTTYFYVTTAVDSIGDESVYSNEASAVIP
jgi:hypothetical protein